MSVFKSGRVWVSVVVHVVVLCFGVWLSNWLCMVAVHLPVTGADTVGLGLGVLVCAVMVFVLSFSATACGIYRSISARRFRPRPPVTALDGLV